MKGRNDKGRFTEGNNYGRPPRFKTPDEMEILTDDYFKDVIEKDEIPTIFNYADYLGFCTYGALQYYQGNKEPFMSIIKKAKERILDIQLKMAMRNKINATVFIFNAKNKHGMKDKVEQEITERRIIIDIDENNT